MRAPRLTARGRLTVLHTGLVLTAGTVLAAFTYVLMRENLEVGPVLVRWAPGGGADPVPPPPLSELRSLADELRAETLSEFLTQTVVALAAVALLAAGSSWLLAGRVLRPIREITLAAQRLSAENLSERVPVNAPTDDLARLAGTINGMLDRIQRSVAERDRVLESQRMFTANAAHELRTPLTTMRAALDVTLDGEPTRGELLAMATDIRNAIDQSQRTLDGLLALARSQAGPGDQQAIDLTEVVTGMLDHAGHEAAAAARDVTLRIDLRPAPVTGDPVLLERMASNLVDNAIRYNHPGGEIAVATGTENGQSVLRVTNTGRLVPLERADALLEPFVRGGGSRTRRDGAGLGLSIARAVVVAHRGEIALTARPTGGLDVTVRLPDGAGSVAQTAELGT